MPYPSRGAWRFRNVTQDFDFSPILDSIAIEEVHPDGLSTLACEVRDEGGIDFANEDRVWCKFGGDKIWAGHVKVRTRTFLDNRRGTRKSWRLEGQDYTSKLDDSVVTTRGWRNRESGNARVAFILAHLNFDVTTDGVADLEQIVERFMYENLTVREALQHVADELALHFYVDFGPDDGGPPDLHMFRLESFDAPFEIDADEPNYTSRFPPADFSVHGDSADLKTAVHVRGDRIRTWVVDQDAIDAHGRQEAPVTDTTLTTIAQAKAAGERLLDQNADPEVHGELTCHEPGMRAGMTFHARLDDWSIDTNYVATGVTITAVDPEDEAGEAYLASHVAFSDKRRVGRMPGGGRPGGGGRRRKGDGRDDPQGGQGGGHGGGSGGCGCPADLTDGGLLLWDGFDRTASEDAGQTPDATDLRAWWPGGNVWVGVVVDVTMDDWGTDGSLLYFESSTLNAGYTLRVLPDDGDLPLEVDEWELLMRYRLTTAGDTGDVGIRAAGFAWAGGDEVILEFGSTLEDEGIKASGSTLDFLVKSLGVGTWNLVRWQYDGTQHRARVWTETDDEPTTWDVECDAFGATASNIATEGFAMAGRLGNDGPPAQRLELDWLKVVIPSAPGELVRRSVPHGSGGTVDVGEPFEAGSLSVTVDGQPATPESQDADAGTFDLGYEPDHDPDNHPDGCAHVVVTYRVA